MVGFVDVFRVSLVSVGGGRVCLQGPDAAPDLTAVFISGEQTKTGQKQAANTLMSSMSMGKQRQWMKMKHMFADFK